MFQHSAVEYRHVIHDVTIPVDVTVVTFGIRRHTLCKPLVTYRSPWRALQDL